MEHAYKLLFIFRPVVWALIAALVVMFGNAFFKKLINAVVVFLFVIGISGGIFMGNYITEVMDPFNFSTRDDYVNCIVGSVTVICIMICGVAYLLIAQTIDTGDGRPIKHKELKEKIAGRLFGLVLPFAVMGYCLPFFFLDSVAGIVVGVIGEIVGVLILIAIMRKLGKKKESES